MISRQDQPRQPAGRPTGGRFASKYFSEPMIALVTSKQPIDLNPLIYQDHDLQPLYEELRTSGLGGTAIHGVEEHSVIWEPADGIGSFHVEMDDRGEYRVSDLDTGDDYLVYEVPEGDGRTASDAESRDILTAKKPEEAIECMKMLRANSLGRKIASSIYAGKVSRVDLQKGVVLHNGRFQEQLEADIELGPGDGPRDVLHYGSLVDRLEIRRDGRQLGGEELETAAAELCGTTASGSPGVSPVDHLKKATAQLVADVKARDDVAFRPDTIEL